jgi:hypothetical protein
MGRYGVVWFRTVLIAHLTYAPFSFVEQHKTGQPPGAAGAGAAAVGSIVPKSSKICDAK